MPFTPPADTPWARHADPGQLALLARAERLAAENGCDLVDALRFLELQANPTMAIPPQWKLAGLQVDEARLAQLQQTQLLTLRGHSFEEAVRLVELGTESGIVTLRVDAGGVVQLRGEPIAANGARTFKGVAYSGGVVPNFSFMGDFAIDLAGLSLPAGDVPLLLNHDPNRIVGRAAVSNDGKQLSIVRGQLSTVTDEGRKVAGLLAEGQPWALSVGVNGKHRNADRARGERLNGRLLNVDTVMFNARLLEVSLVPAGADPGAALS